jgi:PilZ domain
MTLKLDRRRYPRFAVRLPFQLWLATDKGDPWVATLFTKNISKAGLCFLAPRQVQPGESITVDLTLAGYGQRGKDVNISGVGQIVRAAACDEPGKYELAATFEVPPLGHGPGWNQLATVFEELT